MNEAVAKVRDGSMGLRKAAETYGLPYTTLQRRVSAPADKTIGNMGRKPVLSQELEDALSRRLIELSKRGFGLTPTSVRKYVFHFAVERGLKHNFNMEKEMAGEDWFHSFMGRHPGLSIRKPKSISRARASSLTEERVKEFYEELEAVIKDCNLEGRPEAIYNQDETGLPLNNRPPIFLLR